MEENCLICYDKCRPDFNTYLTQNPDLKEEVCNLFCEIYKLSNKDLILDLKNYFNFCQLCFGDLARVDSTLKSLKKLQESLKNDREELDNRIRESHKRFRVVPSKNRVINSVRDEIIRKISENAQTPSEDESFGFLSNEEPEGIAISNEILQEEEDPFQNLDDLSPILGDIDVVEGDMKFSIINVERVPEIHPIKLPKAVMKLPKLPEEIPERISLNDPLIQAFLQSQRKQPTPKQKRQKEASQPTNPPNQIHNQIHNCFFCEKSFRDRMILFRHNKKYHKDDLYPCSEGSCSDQFRTLKDLKIHQRGVHNIHEYECYFCPEILKSQTELLSHKKAQHSHTFFVCPVTSCPKEFTKKDSFDNHIKVKHGDGSRSPEAKFPCTTEGCGKLFVTKFQLKIHLRAHRAKEQTYPCPFEGCNRIFTTRTGRRYHFIKVHKSTNQDLIAQLQQNSGKILGPENVQTTAVSSSEFDFPAEDEPDGIIISNEISQEEYPFENLDNFGYDSSRILDDKEEELEISEVKVSIIDDKEPTPMILKNHTKLKKAILILPKLPQSIQEHPMPISIIDPLVQTFIISKTNKHHLKMKHSSNPEKAKISCSKKGCGKLFATKFQLNNHLSLHPENVYSCTKAGCDLSFQSRVGLSLHLKVHESNHWLCSKCSTSFGHKSALTEHGKDCQGQSSSVSGLQERATHQCPTCGKTFYTDHNLKNHLARMHGNGYKSYPKGLQIIRRKRCTKPINFLCEFCSKFFNGKQNLVQHLKVVHPSKERIKHQCNFCTKSYYAARYLDFHIKQTHKKEHNHFCDRCGSGFASWGRLNQHQKTHIFTLPCRFCHKRFSSQGARASHEVTHSNEMAFQCTQCPKSFRYKLDLKNHEVMKHSAKNFFSYACERCGRQFKIKRQFIEHGVKCMVNND